MDPRVGIQDGAEVDVWNVQPEEPHDIVGKFGDAPTRAGLRWVKAAFDELLNENLLTGEIVEIDPEVNGKGSGADVQFRVIVYFAEVFLGTIAVSDFATLQPNELIRS